MYNFHWIGGNLEIIIGSTRYLFLILMLSIITSSLFLFYSKYIYFSQNDYTSLYVSGMGLSNIIIPMDMIDMLYDNRNNVKINHIQSNNCQFYRIISYYILTYIFVGSGSYISERYNRIGFIVGIILSCFNRLINLIIPSLKLSKFIENSVLKFISSNSNYILTPQINVFNRPFFMSFVVFYYKVLNTIFCPIYLSHKFSGMILKKIPLKVDDDDNDGFENNSNYDDENEISLEERMEL